MFNINDYLNIDHWSLDMDLVILDLVMPGGGQNAFREIKQSGPKLPILISSGYAAHGDGTVSALLAAGAVGFLRKPYEIEELRDAVAHALGNVDP